MTVVIREAWECKRFGRLQTATNGRIQDAKFLICALMSDSNRKETAKCKDDEEPSERNRSEVEH